MRALLKAGAVVFASAVFCVTMSFTVYAEPAGESLLEFDLPAAEQPLHTTNAAAPESGQTEASQAQTEPNVQSALPQSEAPLNAAQSEPSVVQPKTDVALPSTETPLVPKGMMEDMKKQPLNEVTQQPARPATQAPEVAPLVPVPAEAAQNQTAQPNAMQEQKKEVADTEGVKTPEAVGRVIWVKGVLTAEHEGKQARKMAKSSIIFVGDTLVTDSKTQAQIAFTDTTLMTFRPGTKFIVTQYSYKPKEKAESGSVGKFVMNLVAGGFRTITGLISKGNNADYEVKTPVATIGVRGTDYSVYVGGNDQMVMGQMSGIPTITNQRGETTELTSENKYARVNADGSIEILTERPPVLEVSLPIVPATLEPITPEEAAGTFGAESSGGGGSGEWCVL